MFRPLHKGILAANRFFFLLFVLLFLLKDVGLDFSKTEFVKNDFVSHEGLWINAQCHTD